MSGTLPFLSYANGLLRVYLGIGGEAYAQADRTPRLMRRGFHIYFIFVFINSLLAYEPANGP